MKAITCFMFLFGMDVICHFIFSDGSNWNDVIWALWYQGFTLLTYGLFIKVD